MNGPNWEAEAKMYATSAISPPFIVHSLSRAKYLRSGAKILLVSSESGSITLRHEKEGGGNYGHHASKAALNMVGKLLSLDLKDKGVIVSIVHPGFMRTEMTKGVGFDKYWDDGGAVTPDQAADSLVKWVDDLSMEKTGQYWAPRGPRMYSPELNKLIRIDLSRGHWHRGCYNWGEFANTIATTMVDLKPQHLSMNFENSINGLAADMKRRTIQAIPAT